MNKTMASSSRSTISMPYEAPICVPGYSQNRTQLSGSQSVSVQLNSTDYYEISASKRLSVVDEAIERMQQNPNVEFLCSANKLNAEMSQYGYSTTHSKLNQVPNEQFLFAGEININNFESTSQYSFTRPKYQFQSSHDSRIAVADTSTAVRRSHSINIVSPKCTSSTLNQILSNKITEISGPIRPMSNSANHGVSLRRSTIHRFSETEDLFFPKESWLTSLYGKLPKSKTFCRFQLELLNLPLFASVGRFLEETASGGDTKTMLDPNSFLFALFNQFVPHNRIPLNTLSKHVRRLNKYEILATIEFNFLRTSSTIVSNRRSDESHCMRTIRHASKRENLAKNTNQKYVPYDYNRVILHSNEDNRSTCKSDYINASLVDSILKPNAYIVAQGPNENTIGDFWRMIWQQNVHVVVMLTKVYEFIRVMCTQYWPSNLNQPELFDNQFEVIMVDEDKLADYVVRTMKVRRISDSKCGSKRRKDPTSEFQYSNNNDQPAQSSSSSATSSSKNRIDSSDDYRTIYQLHFLSWKINSCPYSDSILKFRRRVQIYEKQFRADSAGPLLVHCSNGCGRSGAYVCLDANLQLAEEEGIVDIFNYAKNLRKFRVDMIENLEQYKFIYETIEESYVCGKTWFHVSEISQQMKHKSVKNKITKCNEYQLEFEKLLKMTSKFSIGDCAGGHRLENRYKNRDVSIVPPDNFRPYLTSFQFNDQSDYINAVFVDGYSRPREYIVTEWPLKKTIPHLWSLIYDHDCNTVVVLGGIPANNKSFPMFWPKDSVECKYGTFTVETWSHNHQPKINHWLLKVQKKLSLTELMAGMKAQPKMTQVFEFEAWPYDYKVPTSTNSLVELIHMVERWRQRSSYGPVLVVSGNGKSRVGVYCAANFAIEQVVAHEEIDIFNAVKTVRRHRSALIETIMEYKYCYDLTLHYVSHYMNKGNYNQIFKK